MIDPRDDRAALCALSDERFAAFVADLVEAAHPGWTAELSPPSPDRSVDARLDRGDERRLLQVRRDDADARVGAPPVRNLLAVRDAGGFDAVALATTAAFDESARGAADDDAALYDGADLVRWADEAGVPIPERRAGDDGEAESDDLDRVVADLTAYWPAGLAERAGAVVRAVDGRAPFERRVHRGDASAELRFRVDGETLVRARFSETSFLLFVERDGGPEPVVRLSAFRDDQPPLADLDVESAVDGALDRR